MYTHPHSPGRLHFQTPLPTTLGFEHYPHFSNITDPAFFCLTKRASERYNEFSGPNIMKNHRLMFETASRVISTFCSELPSRGLQEIQNLKNPELYLNFTEHCFPQPSPFPRKPQSIKRLHRSSLRTFLCSLAKSRVLST
jgi:hypothetical protein